MSSRSKRRRFWRRLAKLPQEVYERIFRFGKRIASPVEEFSERSVERVSTLADNFNKLETRAIRATKVLRRPFKFIIRLPQTILYMLVSHRRVAAFGKPFRHAVKHTRESFVRLAEALFIDRFFIRFAKLTKPVWYPLAAFSGFMRAWWRTRKLKRLGWGIPLLILLLPLSALAAWLIFTGQSGIAANYQSAISEARATKDYSRLHLLERKLAQLGADTRPMEFNTILALERDGQLGVAYQRAQRLAGTEDLDYAPAHLWIVEHLLAKKLPVAKNEAPQLVEQHLNALAKLGFRNRELNLLRGLALVQQERLSEAGDIFRPLVDEVPLAAIQRLQIDLELKHLDDAHHDALAVRQHLERQRRGGTALKPGEYQCWAKAEKFLNDPSRYRAVLVDWLKADPQNIEARKSLAQILIREFDELLAAPQPDPQMLAERLRAAFALTAIPETFKLRLVALYQQKSSSPVLQDLFAQLAHANDLAASLAELLGTVAGVEGEWSQAEVWTRQAVTKDERNAIAWNNLACILLQKDDVQVLDEALIAANHAVGLANDDYRFRETRGQIFLRLKRPQEAVSDLEFALNGMPQATAIHRSLAAAYDDLGNKQLAALHRDQSQ